jgi:hypothetical protein
MENQITIKPTFDTQSIFKATLSVWLGSPMLIFVCIILVIQLYNVFLNGAGLLNSWAPLLITILALGGLLPLALYNVSKKQIKENPKLKEEILYTLNQEYFFEKAETYEVKYFWRELIKIQEKNDFFLIYVRKNAAKIIKKSDLKDNQYNELKTLFNSLPIKKSLK